MANRVKSIGPLENEIPLLQAGGDIEYSGALLPDPSLYNHVSKKMALIGQAALSSGHSWREGDPPEELPLREALLLAQCPQYLLCQVAVGGAGDDHHGMGVHSLLNSGVDG